MTVQYTNCHRIAYYLREGITKNGSPRYYFSTSHRGKPCERIPDGYEIYEEPNGRPSLRKILVPLISEIEIRIIENSIPKEVNYKLVTKRRSVTVYTAEELSILYQVFGRHFFDKYRKRLRFVLVNKKNRMFDVESYSLTTNIDKDDEYIMNGPTRVVPGT